MHPALYFMNEVYEYRYNDRDDLINKNYLFNKALNKLIKKYKGIPSVNLSFQKDENTKTIKLANYTLRDYREEIRKDIIELFQKIYNR